MVSINDNNLNEDSNEINFEETNNALHSHLGTLSLRNILSYLTYMEDGLEVVIGDYKGKNCFDFVLDGNYCGYEGSPLNIALCTIYVGHLDYLPFTVGDLKRLVLKAITEGVMFDSNGNSYSITEDTYVYISNKGICSDLALIDINFNNEKIFLELKNNKVI